MKHYKPIKCVVCSKVFTPTAANQNTCCEAHRQQRATDNIWQSNIKRK